jgi:DNA-binding protein H-NS
MSEAMKTLLNLRQLRAGAKEYTLEQLQEMLDKLQTVVAEKEEFEAEAMSQEKERQDRLNEYRQMLIKDGIDPEELLAGLPPVQKSKRTPRPAKYRFIDENGDEKTWTGQGRTPSSLKKSLDEGHKLEEFEI